MQDAANSGYAVGTQVTQILLNARVEFIDGAGSLLGFAGPAATFVDQLGYRLSARGSMAFDTADVASLSSAGLLTPAVLHEVAPVLGFGTLWTDNGVYVEGSGEFTGAAATAAWQTEFGPGTANAHWNENPTIVDTQGRSMQDELMTGFVDRNPYISQTTVASFADIGFVTAPVPEPATCALFGLGVLAVAARVRRRA